MNRFIKKIFKYRLVSGLSIAAFVFVLGGAIWNWAAVTASGNAPYILHFDDVNGITQVGGIRDLVFVSVLGIVIVLMNYVIALELEVRDPVLGKIISALTLVFAILLFIGFVAIINVN